MRSYYIYHLTPMPEENESYYFLHGNRNLQNTIWSAHQSNIMQKSCKLQVLITSLCEHSNKTIIVIILQVEKIMQKTKVTEKYFYYKYIYKYIYCSICHYMFYNIIISILIITVFYICLWSFYDTESCCGYVCENQVKCLQSFIFILSSCFHMKN